MQKTKLFAIPVIMAIVTILKASPVFGWVYGRHVRGRKLNEAWQKHVTRGTSTILRLTPSTGEQ